MSGHLKSQLELKIEELERKISELEKKLERLEPVKKIYDRVVEELDPQVKELRKIMDTYMAMNNVADYVDDMETVSKIKKELIEKFKKQKDMLIKNLFKVFAEAIIREFEEKYNLNISHLVNKNEPLL